AYRFASYKWKRSTHEENSTHSVGLSMLLQQHASQRASRNWIQKPRTTRALLGSNDFYAAMSVRNDVARNAAEQQPLYPPETPRTNEDRVCPRDLCRGEDRFPRIAVNKEGSGD